MADLRIKGDVSGYVDLVAPDVAGSTTIDLSKVLVADSSGNVGIGTTSPAANLDVNGNARIRDQLSIIKPSTGTTKNVMQYWLHSSENTLNLNMYGGSTDLVQFAATNGEQNIAIVTDSSANINATNTKGIYIKSGGNVGIGTTSPSANLDVSGARNDTSLHLRSGDNNIASGGGNQITLSYDGGTNYKHNIKTRHDSNNISNNTFDFYVWQPTQSASDNGNRHVARFDGYGVLTPTSPAFSAVCGTHAVNGDLVFGNANINRGNHYNTSNGRFTAPIAGAYAFMFYGMAENGNTNLRARIHINGSSHQAGEHVGGVSYQASGTYQQMVLNTILDLNAGDYVNIHWQSSYGSMHSWHNKFSGWLLG